MNILHIVKLYYPWIGGVEKVAREIVEGIQHDANVHVLCCQHRGRGSREFIGGVEVIKAGSFGMFFSMPISFPFWYLFRKEAQWADILHFHHPFPLADIIYLLFAPKNKKVVITWHSDIWRQKRFLSVYKPIRQMFLQRADRILVTSENLLKNSECLQEFKEKCRVMPLFIDTEYWKNLKERAVMLDSLRRSADSENDKKIVLFVGRLVYYKGIEYLIEAMKGIDAFLVIVGSGPLKQDLKQKIKKENLSQNILFIPHLTDEELKWCYQHAHVFVLPSVEKTEAFGLVQLEAMFFSLPVINTNLSTGVPSVSIHGETGLTVAPRDSKALHDAIQKILTDERLARSMGERGHIRVEEVFGKKKAIADILEMYKEVLNVEDENSDLST